MGSVRRIEGALCVGALLFSGAARADVQTSAKAEAARFHLAYEAPSGCPDRPAFLAAIHAQTPRPQLAGEGEAAISLAVTIDVGRSRSSGRLDVREPDGARETRSVSSRTCGEVVKALALVAALILDPESQTGPESPRALPKEEGPPPSAASAPVPPAPPTPAGPPPPARPTTPAPPVAEGRRRPWALSAGVEIGALGGIGPSLAPMGGVFVDGELTPQSQGYAARLLTPAVRVTVDVATISSDLAVGSQRYEWLGGSLRLCPVHLPLPARFRIAPCGALQVGVHRASTVDTPSPTESIDLRLAPEVGGSIDWAASSAVTVELQGGALFPLRRSRYFLAPMTTIFSVPAATAMLTVGLRVRFF
jgi:hypothetical protein